MSLFAVIIGGLGQSPGVLDAQEPSAATSEVFRRYSDQVVKIEVIETGSAAKATLGSGFFVSSAGHVITNYHVISKLVHDPGRYRAELTDTKATSRPIRLLAVDVVHDLAILGSDVRPDRFFSLGQAPLPQGTRLYALGHPKDLGLSIVEGTYNGLLEHTLYPKIHFTGALNPGMSGGPAISSSGKVIGVNVSSEGEEVSFLVPVERAESLLARALAPGFVASRKFLGDVAAQLRAYQATSLGNLFAPGIPTVTLGPFTLPTKPTAFFKCWADATRNAEAPYEIADHQCSTEDYIFVSNEQSSGIVELHHRVITNRGLNRVQFYSLYQHQFDQVMTQGGSEEDVTSFECTTRNVRQATLTLRTVLCVRRYRKLDGLYDAVLKAAALGVDQRGLVTTLKLWGVSFESLQQLSRRYLERMAWRE